MSFQQNNKISTDRVQSVHLDSNELNIPNLIETTIINKIPILTNRMHEKLLENKINTLYDLFYFSQIQLIDYQTSDFFERSDRANLKVIGNIVSVSRATFSNAKVKSGTNFVLSTKFGMIKCIAFNQAYLAKSLKIGTLYFVDATYNAMRDQLSVNRIKAVSQINYNQLEVKYQLEGKMKSSELRVAITKMLTLYEEMIVDIIPLKQRQKYKLLSRKQALLKLHFPKNTQEYEAALRTLKYEEFFIFQMKLRLKNVVEKSGQGRTHEVDFQILKNATKELPWKLTSDQKRVLDEIIYDLKSPDQMYRLLQGDVGSGKTIIAFLSILAVVRGGAQALFIAPTEVLARQHFEHALTFFTKYNINVSLLVGSTKAKDRKQIFSDLIDGTTNVIIGTHALLEANVVFNDLGYVITDEQHRFGVNQRKLLREKGTKVDILYMSATPIPRTLSISIFGDLDISTIRELPSGRKVIKTSFVEKGTEARVFSKLLTQLKKGHQAYIITPLIEESEVLDVENATQLYEEIAHSFEGFKVGLLHGRLKPDQKKEVLKQFYNLELHILVSTTVIEVGVNVPNATVMMIYDAQRFGLAQLHQLRGRVGRGEHQSYCYLLANSQSKKRLEILEQTGDGFKIAERDLEIRGPGDFFGKRQSGMPVFLFADIVEDKNMLEVVRQETKYVIDDEAQIDTKYLKYLMNKSIEIND